MDLASQEQVSMSLIDRSGDTDWSIDRSWSIVYDKTMPLHPCHCYHSSHYGTMCKATKMTCQWLHHWWKTQWPREFYSISPKAFLAPRPLAAMSSTRSPWSGLGCQEQHTHGMIVIFSYCYYSVYTWLCKSEFTALLFWWCPPPQSQVSISSPHQLSS